ncbi:MAG: hypothetical protein Ct9H90mP15_08350 [Candidatus Neomarinimicrobiota bacterium]|nr:MAG: hypothetical protein Ct9H90mP15_08350 [Candidatus Neomarinimicrobiota bacterium]
MIEVIFTLYLLLIISVGILSNKFISSQLDFLLAGVTWSLGYSLF